MAQSLTSPITLTTAELNINKSLTITGPGANQLTVQRSAAGGTPDFRIFKINSGNTVSISGLTISNGQTPASFGGGIWNELSVLNLHNCTVSGNSAVHGGGIFNNIGTLNVTNSTFIGNSAVNNGGGIISDNDSTLNISNSTFSGNSANAGGAVANDSIATVTNSTFTGNTGFAQGGGIFNQPSDQVSIRNSILALNTSASTCGGSCPNGSPDLSGDFTSLGHNLIGKSDGSTGFTNGSNGDQVGSVASPLDPRLGPLANNGGPTQTHALLADSTAIDAGNNCVVDNSCTPPLGLSLTTDQRGAGFPRSNDGDGDGTSTVDIGAFEVQVILVTNTNDSGSGSLRQAITDANTSAATDAINFQSGLTGTITLLTALPDLSTSMSINGPGANNLTVQRSAVPATPQFRIFTVSVAGSVQVQGLTISNGLTANGGGILNQNNATLILRNCSISGNAADFGGGVRNEGILTVISSTISGNTANAFAGGGIINRGSAASATIINSTVSGNQAGAGGGIFDDGITTSLRLTNCTITNNTATAGGSASGLHTNNQSNSSPQNAKVRNTIIAGNTGTSPELLGFFTSEGNNLIGKSDGTNGFSNGSNGDKVGTVALPLDPLLGPLANNGGPTQTHALLPGSPAIDSGNNCVVLASGSGGCLTTPLTTDQRGAGFPRQVNGTVDIGAFESRGFTIAATGGTPQSAIILTAFGSPLVATVGSAFGEPVAGGKVTFAAPGSGASGTFTGNALNAIVTIDGSGVATAPTFTANGTAGGPYNVVASIGTPLPTAAFALTNLKANQTITVNTHAPASATYNTSFTVAATSSSGLAVSYSSSGVCTNVGATFTMTSGTGTCTVKYDQAGNSNYNAAPQVTESVTAQKANQTINFGGLSPKTFGDADFGVSATATSNLAVSFTASGQCTVTSTTVHLTGGGSCTITAKQAADSNYNAAPDVPQSFNIAKAPSTTGVSSSVNPSDFGQSVTFTATVTSGAGTPTGTVQFKDSGINIGSPQTMTAGVAQLTTSSLAVGLHTITADYSGDGNFLTSSGSLSGGQVVKTQPSLSINDVTLAEGNSGTTSLVFTVTLSATSSLTVNVDYAAANGSATVADNDYQANTSTLTFNPGDLTKTVTVLVNGDQKFELDETVLVNLSNPLNATISDSQGVGTILNDDTLQLILEESGPDPNQAAAFESILLTRDPFRVLSIASWLDLGPDRNTRVIIFVANLQLNQGETASDVVVSLIDSNSQTYDVAAEDVRLVPNTNFTQVTFRLPDALSAGTCLVTVKAHGQISNTGTIRIVP
jgi:hypothetical protein